MVRPRAFGTTICRTRFTIDGNGLRRSSTPLRVDASGSIDLGPAGDIEFSLGLRLFGGDHDVRGIVLDDTKIENVPCGCAVGTPDPPHHLMPWEPGFSPIGGFRSLHYDPGLGLVISSQTGFVGPYITRISETLLNDDPTDDIDAYFYHPFAGDAPTPSLEVTRLVAKGQFGDPDSGIANPTNSSVIGAPGGGGLVALQPGASGSVVRVMEPTALGKASPLASTSARPSCDRTIRDHPRGLAGRRTAYSTGWSPNCVDPQTGLPVNDFGENGFDSGPAEPRFFGIRDSVPGDWSIEMIGTADGPFAINVYGIDLDQSTGHRARMTGRASTGSQLATIFRFDAAGTVELFPPVPEPTTVGLLIVGMLAILSRRPFKLS